MDTVHRPYLRFNCLGGTQIWFTNYSEAPCCDHRLDRDVESAVEKIKRLAQSSTRNVHTSKAEGAREQQS